MFSYELVGKSRMGKNPHNQVGSEIPLHIQGSGLRWDLNRGPYRWKAGEETLEPTCSKFVFSTFRSVKFFNLFILFPAYFCSNQVPSQAHISMTWWMPSMPPMFLIFCNMVVLKENSCCRKSAVLKWYV